VPASIDARLADWEARLDRLEGRRALRIQPEPAEEPESDATDGHVLFVPSPSGYELVERVGEFPSVSEPLELDGPDGRYAVMRIVRSPLPGDRRRCAYLEII